jgi:hypothetical protein
VFGSLNELLTRYSTLYEERSRRSPGTLKTHSKLQFKYIQYLR